MCYGTIMNKQLTTKRWPLYKSIQVRKFTQQFFISQNRIIILHFSVW